MKKWLLVVLSFCIFLSGTAVSAQLESDIWTRNTDFFVEDYTDILYANGLYVAIGYGGTISTSIDAQNWTVRYAAPIGQVNLVQIAWSGSRFVAITDNPYGGYLTSTNGIDWEYREVGSGMLCFNAILWYGNQFIIAGDTGIHTSNNGLDWIKRSTGSVISLATNGSQLIAFLEGFPVSIYNQATTSSSGKRVMISSNGTSWAERDMTITHIPEGNYTFQEITAAVWDGSKYIALGYTYNGSCIDTLLTSSNGISWTATLPADSSEKYTSILCTGQKTVVFGNGFVMSSDNDLNWNKSTLSEQRSMKAAVLKDNRYIAVGTEGAICTSTDLVNWTSNSTEELIDIKGVAANDSGWVAVCSNGKLLTSSDALSWSIHDSGVTASLKSIVWTGTQFVIASVNNDVITSPDGVTWTVHAPPANIISFYWNGKQFIGKESNGKAATSVDAMNWTHTDYSYFLDQCVWDGQKFVGVLGKSIYTSQDGLQWGLQATPTSYNIASIAWNGSIFVAAGGPSDKVTLTSANGINWNSSGSGIKSNKVIWAGDRFISFGNLYDHAFLGMTTTGATWTLRRMFTNVNQMTDAAWKGAKTVIVGDNGVLVTLTNPNYNPSVAVAGDINGDGNINVADVVMASEIAVGSPNYTTEQKARANVKSKTQVPVDISDVVLILERCVGGTNPFPAEE